MKGERLMQLELLLLSHPEGMRRAEIARRLGVHRSTIGRYIDELKKHTDVYEDKYLIKIVAREEIDIMKLSVYESLALNLSAEMLAKYEPMQTPHLASGLRKIAGNMRTYAPHVSNNIDEVAEQIETTTQRPHPSFTKTLEVIIDSWVSGKMLRIKHIDPKNSLLETEFAPYFIGYRESSSGRRPISVTGRLRHTSEIETIDILNIKEAEILDETYTIPDNLRPFRKPVTGERYSGIDMIPLKMVLKERSALNSFSSIFYDRLETYKDDEGRLICEMNAENSIELILRIAQCRTSVEILEPEGFRKRFIAYLQEILTIYTD
ncbi:MAG: WYL domain-containing transcriptional regulator [Spirochaetia bacterium]|nr:WYL domain-containing transcriptional regulator [Spirochaetia bacterium]MCF7941677.1 WYL domain-containing transcriptional regulator [Spirochaetia bacterium]